MGRRAAVGHGWAGVIGIFDQPDVLQILGQIECENDIIADCLARLTANQRNWGFGLCLLYLRNIKGFKRNYERVYRLYRTSYTQVRQPPHAA